MPQRSKDPRVIKHFAVTCLHCNFPLKSLGDIKLHITTDCDHLRPIQLFCGCCSLTYDDYHTIVNHFQMSGAHLRVPVSTPSLAPSYATVQTPLVSVTFPQIRIVTTTLQTQASPQPVLNTIPPTQLLESPLTATSSTLPHTQTSPHSPNPLAIASPLLSQSLTDLIADVLPLTPMPPTAAQRTPQDTDTSDSSQSLGPTPLPSHLSLSPFLNQFQPTVTPTTQPPNPYQDQVINHLLHENNTLRAQSIALAHHSLWLTNLLIANLSISPQPSSSDRDARRLLANSPVWINDRSNPDTLPLLNLLERLKPVYSSVIFPSQ